PDGHLTALSAPSQDRELLNRPGAGGFYSDKDSASGMLSMQLIDLITGRSFRLSYFSFRVFRILMSFASVLI
ncbi:MAG: hypothetical protein ACXAEL_07470, partial [Candidatus Hodarchaeales archaeon]